MKCSKCGCHARTIGAMACHYRKAHPGAMKRRRSAGRMVRIGGGPAERLDQMALSEYVRRIIAAGGKVVFE